MAVTWICGVVVIKQLAVTLLVTAPPQVLLPVAVETLVTEQFVGATKLPVNFAESPGAKTANVSTGVVPLRLFSTMTLVSITLPLLLTVPP